MQISVPLLAPFLTLHYFSNPSFQSSTSNSFSPNSEKHQNLGFPSPRVPEPPFLVSPLLLSLRLQLGFQFIVSWLLFLL